MRVVFVNMHSNVFFMKTLPSIVYKHSVATKHRFILDYLIDNPDVEVCNFINDKGFSLVQNRWRGLQPLWKFLSKFEYRYILNKNGIDRGKITLIRRISDIKDDDIVISYIHDWSSLHQLNQIKAFKAVSVLHIYCKSIESNLLKEANPDILYGEFDVKQHSKIFQDVYSWYDKGFLSFPFVYGDRFKSVTPFSDRSDKAFSVGTITRARHEEFVRIYGVDCLQPSRKQIFDNRESLKSLIDCYNSEYYEGFKPVQISEKMPSFIKTLVSLYNTRHTGNQKSYFSFNMVEEFNKHKMFICGEEATGSPAIGFVEGMACGCAYIGIKGGAYEDYGMQEGVHYIGYDGSLDDLKNKISYYQCPENQKELEEIAKAGQKYAQTHFRKDVVAAEFWSKLLDSKKDWVSSHKN